jgi:replicative superfamily II helicase
VQREVFDGWFPRRAERDLVIRMNTGNGKTLVGLMLLKSALNEHSGPAAYLTPDPVYLVDQVESAARDLGLSTSRDSRDPSVASGSAIPLATVKTLFNGRSKFGVMPEGRKIKLGTVLIADAHACLATAEDQFAVRLPVTHPAYGRLSAWPRPGSG